MASKQSTSTMSLEEARKDGRRETAEIVILPVAGVVLAVAIWWIIVKTFDVQTVILPAPDEVLAAFVSLREELFKQAVSTATATLIGFAASAVIGLIIGGAIALSRTFESMVHPLLVAFNAIPKVALAPLLLVWLGYGKVPVLAMGFMVCFFPVVLSTVSGLTSTPVELADLTRSMKASRWQMFRYIRFPAALPQIFVGFKVALPLAVIGVVVGEMQYGESGLGMLIVQTSGQADTASAFSAIVLLAIISVVLFYLLVLLERFTLPWVAATTSVR